MLCGVSVRSVPALTALKSTGHDSFLSTWKRPSHMTEKTTTSGLHSTEPESVPWLLGVCRVIAPFPSCPRPPLWPLISASAHPRPRAAGWERWAGVTGTLSPIQRRRPQGKEERKIYTVSTSLLYVVIYSLTQRRADIEPRTPQL